MARDEGVGSEHEVAMIMLQCVSMVRDDDDVTG